MQVYPSVTIRFTIEARQQQSFQFTYQGIPGIGACTLIIKSIFSQFIELIQEIGFFDTGFLNRGRDPQSLLQLLDFGYQTLDFFGVTQPSVCQLKVIGNGGIAAERLGSVILAEGGLLGRQVGGVETDDIAYEQSIGQTVGRWNSAPNLWAIE